ncbi:MAG: MerR family transcriptional regulator [Pseudomonadota bacterium]
MEKAPDAFRTISEVADDLDIPQHVLRFWETRFSQIKPMKRSGGRRYYRPDDVDLLKGIRHLLYGEGYTIRGVQRILKEQGVRSVQGLASGDAAADARPRGMEAARDDEIDETIDQGDEDEIEDEEEEEIAPPVVRAAPAAPLKPPEQRTARDSAPTVTASRIPPVTLVEPGRDAASRMSAEERNKLKAVLRELQACRQILDEAVKRT